MVTQALHHKYWHAWRFEAVSSVSGERVETVLVFDKERLASSLHREWVGGRIWLLTCSEEMIELEETREVGCHENGSGNRPAGRFDDEKAVRSRNILFSLEKNSLEENEYLLTKFVLDHREKVGAGSSEVDSAEYLVLLHMAALFRFGPNWADAKMLAERFKKDVRKFNSGRGKPESPSGLKDSERLDRLGNAEHVYDVAKTVVDAWQKVPLLNGMLLHYEMLAKGAWAQRFNHFDGETNERVNAQTKGKILGDSSYSTIRSAFVSFLLQRSSVAERRTVSRFQELMKAVPRETMALPPVRHTDEQTSWALTECEPGSKWGVAPCLAAIAMEWANGPVTMQQKPMIRELCSFLVQSLYVSEAWRLVKKIPKQGKTTDSSCLKFGSLRRFYEQSYWSSPLCGLLLVLFLWGSWRFLTGCCAIVPDWTYCQGLKSLNSGLRFEFGFLVLGGLFALCCLAFWVRDYYRTPDLQSILFTRIVIGAAVTWTLLFVVGFKNSEYEYPIGFEQLPEIAHWAIAFCALFVIGFLIKREARISDTFAEPSRNGIYQVMAYLFGLVAFLGMTLRFVTKFGKNLMTKEYGCSEFVETFFGQAVEKFNAGCFVAHVAGVLLVTLILYAIIEDSPIIEKS